MNNKLRSIMLAIPLGGVVLCTTGCDELLNLVDPRFSFLRNPRPIYTVVNSATNQAQLVRVSFNRFGTGYKIYSSSVNLPGPKPFSTKPGTPRQGGGTLDPDPDEHQMCPDLWPDPADEFPLPDPPLPMPDYPDEDPFDGLPEPPPFEPDDLTITNISDGTLTIIDTGGTENGSGPTPESSTTGTITVGTQPTGVAATPNESVVVVAVYGSNSVAILQNKAVTGTITGVTTPYAIAISQDGTRAYATSFSRTDGRLFVLDVPNRKVITSLSVGNFPAGVALTPDGSQVWVTGNFDNSIYVFDTLTNTQVTTIGGITNGWGIAFSPSGTRAYVAGADAAAGGLYVIDTSSYQVITRIPVGDGPRTVQVDPGGRFAFVTNRNSNFISQIDVRTNKLVRNIVVGPGAEGIAFTR
jgi:YVTN family beta-propeller protein